MSQGSCRLCHGQVLWVLLPSRKRMAVGLQPDDTGTVAVHRDGTGRHVGRVVSKAEPPMRHERVHRVHVADCAAEQADSPEPARPKQLPPGVADFAKARERRAAKQWTRRRGT